MRTLAIRRIWITWGYVAVFASLTILLDAVFMVPLALILFRRFRFWLYRLFLSSAVCPTCGKAIALVGSWKCGGCGFTQHRHAYKPCVKCGAIVGEVSCPHCQHGMFL